MGMTQQQFADYFGVTRQTVSEWENKHSYPDFLEKAIKLYKLLQHTDYTLEDLAIPPYEEIE